MATIKDVAQKAGVSFKTVSRVLNNEPGVSDRIRQKVLEASAKLGYRPNLSARHMRTGRSNIIGFLTDEITTTPYSFNIVKGAQSAAWEHGKLLSIISTDHDLGAEKRSFEMLSEFDVDGIIYAAMFHREVHLSKLIAQRPVVLVDCFDPSNRFSSLVPDESGGGRLAAEVLLRKGHRRIAFINVSEPSVPAAVGRLQGFREALEEQGTFDPSLVYTAPPYTRHGALEGRLLARTIFERADRPTAIFCATDRIAMGVYSTLYEIGLRIPEDVAVIGFDNQDIVTDGVFPPLTTIELPHYEMGRQAVNLLLETEPGTAPVHLKLPCQYIERASV